MKSISNLSHHPVSGQLKNIYALCLISFSQFTFYDACVLLCADCSKWSSSLNLQQLPCISTKSRTSDSSDSSIKNIYFNLRKKFRKPLLVYTYYNEKKIGLVSSIFIFVFYALFRRRQSEG